MTDWEEIDTESGLLKWTPLNPLVTFPNAWEVVEYSGKSAAFDRFVSFNGLASLSRTEVLPITSNPAEASTVGDGYLDDYKKERGLCAFTWSVSNRDLAMAAQIAYFNLSEGARLDNLPTLLRDKINNNFSDIAKIEELKGWKVYKTHYDFISGFQAVALKNGSNIIVAHRGSNNPLKSNESLLSNTWDTYADWLATNVISGLTGMNQQAPNARSFINEIVAANPNSKIYITGHSLGGQLSYIAAAEAFRRNNGEIKKVVVFNGAGFRINGFEGIGNWFGADTESSRLESNSYLIQNHRVIGDIVPILPLHHHYGQEFTYVANLEVSNHSMYTFIDKLRMYERGGT